MKLSHCPRGVAGAGAPTAQFCDVLLRWLQVAKFAAAPVLWSIPRHLHSQVEVQCLVILAQPMLDMWMVIATPEASGLFACFHCSWRKATAPTACPFSHA